MSERKYTDKHLSIAKRIVLRDIEVARRIQRGAIDPEDLVLIEQCSRSYGYGDLGAEGPQLQARQVLLEGIQEALGDPALVHVVDAGDDEPPPGQHGGTITAEHFIIEVFEPVHVGVTPDGIGRCGGWETYTGDEIRTPESAIEFARHLAAEGQRARVVRVTTTTTYTPEPGTEAIPEQGPATT